MNMRTLVLVMIGLLMAGTAGAHGRQADAKSQGYRSNLVSQSVSQDWRVSRHTKHAYQKGSRLDWLFNSRLNSGVCDELADATPGLRLMCMAFCEMQTCTPDFSLDNPFQSCTKSSKWIYDRYETRRGPGDPDMPCVQQPETAPECPCWSREELAGFRGPSATDRSASCVVNSGSPANGIVNYDAWQILSDPRSPSAYMVSVSSIGVSADGSPACQVSDTCDPATDICLGTSRFMSITPEQFAACEADVAMSAADRGLACVDVSTP